MSAFEAGLRGGAVTLLLLLAVTGWRDAWRSAAARYRVLFDLCAIGYIVETTPPFASAHPPWVIPIQLLSMATPAVFQLWAAATFDDAFTPRWWRWLPFIAMIATAATAVGTDWHAAWLTARAAAFALVGAGLWQTLAGREADLIEGRRRFRLILAIGVGILIAALTLFPLTAGPGLRAAGGALTSGAVLVVAFVAAALRLRTDPTDAFAGRAAPGHGSAIKTAAESGRFDSDGALDRDERAWLERLERLMREERPYREPAIGVAALAARLAIPEYRLRRLINQRLGHRNITTFVNGYRLAETIAALADPSQAQVPILTIALDAGFQSIGPFNRAFKEHTGMTPTAFRRDRLNEAAVRVVG